MNRLNESINCALRVMRFTIQTGLKRTPFKLHNGRKPRTELFNIVEDGKTYLSDWSEIYFSTPNKLKIPYCKVRDADGEITNHMVISMTKTEEKQMNESPNSPRKTSVKDQFKSVEKTITKIIKRKIPKENQTAIDGTKNNKK